MAQPVSDLGTHEVTNQPGPRPAVDPWAADPVLRAHAAAAGGEDAPLAALGRRIVETDAMALGEAARRVPPELVQFDRAGRRLDEVRFHPAYHDLMALGLEAGYAAGPWRGGRHATHAAMVYLMTGVEPGVCCPMTMTYAAVPALRTDADVAAVWEPPMTAAAYDPRAVPVGDKRGATLGMAMTEKQGGSDVRANATTAEPDGRGYRLTGHKWFCSAPMSDGFLTLAQAPGGLTCFLVPRWLPDGARNGIRLMRLKDKLGNRANASAEIEYIRAFAHRLGEEGQGVRTIIRMVHHTRLDTAIAPAGLMRWALAEALHWCEGRTAFQKRLIDQPLMRTVLADLALDWEGALALGMRVAAAFDDEGQGPFARVAVALAKFLANKRAVPVIGEAMEVLGGMGYVEDTPLPMLYREAPLNGIWEGSGNVICLDILRTLGREPAARDALEAELAEARPASLAYGTALSEFQARWPGLPDEAEARAWAERLATLLTAAVLLRTSPVGEAYAASRLGERGLVPGAVHLDAGPILARLTGAA
ncbi:acyl-CoA dehydrogenase family protein [Wenxinia marina]|uniref:Acyl-CoA dehydrogenase n=1 Tax=Wenxinia marina DSM 24838 TaxID=1123501 RepID=A0A0D0QC72_9RHOB|nr:acyl-CoA dehydrogenase family protein [Wenxinia marina]KIQ69912.1 Acyl-CoA dehydrogenase [Wenxinia marina DSM 24838]GGL62156.1 acyl-CoA dehydrogenase [Wenxinia marina]